jgi:hypothetical protein
MLTLTGSSAAETGYVRYQIKQRSFRYCVHLCNGVFELECSFNLADCAECISLKGGNGHTIDSKGLDGFEGLFGIINNVDSYNKAPFLRHLRTDGGKANVVAGLIVRSDQQFLVVSSCTSRGTIMAENRDDTGTRGKAGVVYVVLDVLMEARSRSPDYVLPEMSQFGILVV